jgi:hypothetical protein
MAGKSPFGKKSVPGAVREEIATRATAQGVVWNAKRFVWVRLSSMSSACSDTYRVLSSKPETSVNSMYEAGLKRPKPTITGVDVKKQGELGTTKRATVYITAYTDEQLIELQKCYFIPGMTARVQWGWSVSATGKAAPYPVSGIKPDAEAICEMNTIAESNPHYNGIQGLVGNFSYGLDENGYWDCSIEITAASEAIGESKVGTYDCDCARSFTAESEDGDSEVVDKRSNLFTFLFDINISAQDENFSAFRRYEANVAAIAAQVNETPTVLAVNYEGEDRNESGGSEQSFWSFGNFDTTEGYISWSTLEAAINKYCIPSNGGNYTLGKVASQRIEIPSDAKLDSSDPRICVIGGSPGLTAAIGAGDVIIKGGAIPNTWSPNKMYLNDIMLNCIFLMNELKSVEQGDNTIRSFITNVLNKVNDCCGGIWDLEVVSTTENCADPTKVPTITIIDTKKYEPGAVYELPSLPIKSALRSFKLDMKMSSAMKSQALYSNGEKQNAKGSACDAVGFRPFGLSTGAVKNAAIPRADTKPPCDCESSPAKADHGGETKSISQLLEDMYAAVSDGTTSAVRSAIIENVTKDVEKCKGVMLPFDFSFTLDGIGGFSFGQMVSSTRIPAALREQFEWQITAVEHNVTVQDWTTTVSTVCRYKG